MAGHGEAQYLPHDAGDALISGQDGDGAGLNDFSLSAHDYVRRKQKEVDMGEERLTRLPPALPPTMIILFGSAPSECAFSFAYTYILVRGKLNTTN